jgi:hypothetical protein
MLDGASKSGYKANVHAFGKEAEDMIFRAKNWK